MGAREQEFEDHKRNHARPSGIDARVGGRPKHGGTPVSAHPGMTAQQRTTAGVGGLGNAVQTQDGGHAVSTSKNILEHAYNEDTLNSGVPHPKVRSVPNCPGMRSRTNSKHPNDQGAGDANAARRLAESKLPQTVKEN